MASVPEPEPEREPGSAVGAEALRGEGAGATALQDEESRLDQDFLQQEDRNTRTIEAWVGVTRSSATYKIQSYARGWIARQMFQRQCGAAVMIQSVARGMLCRLQLAQEDLAALAIQAAYRGYCARRKLQVIRTRVISVQAVWRGSRCRAEVRAARIKDVSKQMMRIMANAKVHAALQRWSEWTVESRRLREIGSRTVRRMLRVQLYQMFALWCEWTAETQEERVAAITCLQAALRGWLCRRALAQYRAGMILLQAAIRGATDRAVVALLHRSASQIQARVRGWSTRRHEALRRGRAVVIQRIWRGVSCRSQLEFKHSAATAIQAVERRVQARRQYTKKLAAAQLLQRIWRGYSCRVLLAKLHAFAVVLQSASRARLAQVKYKADLESKRQAQIQAAAAREQAIQRGREERLQQTVEQACARTVKGRMRDKFARKRFHKAAAIVFQKIWRGRQCRLQVLEQRRHDSAVMIQKIWRGTLGKRMFTGIRAAAITVRSCWQSFVKSRLDQETKVAIKLQSHWRMRAERKVYRQLQDIRQVENRGDEAFQKTWFEEAVRDYTAADKLAHGAVPRLKCKRAAAFTGLRMYDEAVKDCDRCLRDQPTCAMAHRRKGTALYAQGNFKDAEASYRECLDLDENDHEAARLLARLTTVLELKNGPRSQLLSEKSRVQQKYSMESALNRPLVRPQEVPRAVARMQRAARYHEILKDRGQSVYELQVDVAGNFKTVKRPKSRQSSGYGASEPNESRRQSGSETADTGALRLPAIGGALPASTTTTA